MKKSYLLFALLGAILILCFCIAVIQTQKKDEEIDRQFEEAHQRAEEYYKENPIIINGEGRNNYYGTLELETENGKKMEEMIQNEYGE